MTKNRKAKQASRAEKAATDAKYTEARRATQGPPRPVPVSTPVEQATISAALNEIFDRLRPLTDADEVYIKHVGYGLLAALWGERAVLDNIDYGFPQPPYDFEGDEGEYEVEILSPAVDRAWVETAAVVEQWGPRRIFETFVAEANTGDSSGIGWLACSRFDEAVEEYGPHPDGFTVVELPRFGGSPGVYSFAVCDIDDPFVGWAAATVEQEWAAKTSTLRL